MRVTNKIEDVRQAVTRARNEGRRIALVPTMGALHIGHCSLIQAAQGTDRYVVVSIFVNPTQFVAGEDFAAYPRPIEADLAACESEGVDLVFTPSPEAMYPADARTAVEVADLTDCLCGPHRPGHFRGVTTVVTKLFNICRPDFAYFGQKDAQQAIVLGRMTEDLNFPIEVVVCPTMREQDGLAISSRNAYLSEGQRRQAVSLHQALQAGRDMILAGAANAGEIVSTMTDVIANAGPADIDYIDIRDATTLAKVDPLQGRVLLALAVRIGSARLIDNILVDVPADPC
jgi:pantoate--beta-alanine ligase